MQRLIGNQPQGGNMKRSVTITASNGSILELRWQAEDINNPNPVTLYQNGTYAGVHTTEHAERAIANARAKGMRIEEMAQ
jgi:hypothetical protein